MSIRFFDMFAGIGGFRSGLERIGGFECVGHCEIDRHANQAYNAIYTPKKEKIFFEDARIINPNEFPDIDLICGGFPCQSFSNAGRRGGFEDARGTLFFEIARIAAVKRPSYLFLENVPGLLSHDCGRTFAVILGALSRLGYDVVWQVLNSKDFGVPQSRKRVCIIGYLGERRAGEILSFAETNGKVPSQIVTERGEMTRTSETDGISKKTSLYFIDMNSEPNLTETARCITARQDSGISNRRGDSGGDIRFAIEYQSGRANIKTTMLNILKGFFACSLIGVVPVELYKFCISLQNSFVKDLTGMISGGYAGSIAEQSLRILHSTLTFGIGGGGLFNILILIAFVYCVVKIFFQNIKRGGILLVQMSVGSLYMFSVPRGYADGFTQWMKQVAGICLTAFMQTTLLFLGLLTFPENMLLGLGIMLAANEVPRIAQQFGLDSSVKVNMMNVMHATTTAVNLTRTVARVGSEKNMKENNEWEEKDIRIDGDMETEGEDGREIVVYIETWFDADKKFNLSINDENNTWLNMYGRFNPFSDTLKIECKISRSDKSEYFYYVPTENEKALIKDLVCAKMIDRYEKTPKEFCEESLEEEQDEKGIIPKFCN